MHIIFHFIPSQLILLLLFNARTYSSTLEYPQRQLILSTLLIFLINPYEDRNPTINVHGPHCQSLGTRLSLVGIFK